MSEAGDRLTRVLAVAGLVTALIGLAFDYRDIKEKDRDRQLQLADLKYEISQLTGPPGAAWLDLDRFDLPRDGEMAHQLQRKTDEALVLAPHDVNSLYYRGVYFLKVGKPDKAVEFFERALLVDRKSSKVHRHLSVACQRRGLLKEAETHARMAISLDPEDPGSYNALGQVLSRREDWKNALAQYRMALEKDPTYFPAYNNVGFVLLRKKDYDGAVSSFSRAVHFNPKSAVAHTNLGLALAEQGHLEEAITHYRMATEVDPDYANAYVALAEILYEQGKRAEAIEQYRVAKQLSPQVKSEELDAVMTTTSISDSAPNSRPRVP